MDSMQTEETREIVERGDLPDTSRKKPVRRRKSRRGWVIGGVLVLAVVVVAAFLLTRPSNAVLAIAQSEVAILSASDIQSTISATGTVESASSTSVYSSLSYKVEEVCVEVGDYVNEGDLLAKLDSKSLERQIASQELSISNSETSSAQSVKTARDSYNAAATALNEGMNSSILSAQNTVTARYDAWVKAQEDYDIFKQKLEEGVNSSVMTQENTVNNAKTAVETAERNLSNAKDNYNRAAEAYRQASENEAGYSSLESSYHSTKASLEAAEASLEDAQAKLEYEQKRLEVAEGDAGKSLADYEKAIDDAWKSYQDAQKSLEAAEHSAKTSLQSSQNSLNTALNGTNNESALLTLSQLKEDLEDTNIKAPVSGTVTAVYATEGSSGSGLLFLIEDIDDLTISTTVREYDVGDVEEGMAVVIRSDATGDDAYDGVITSIAPTSKKTASGAIDTSGDILFDTEVGVTSGDTRLKVGMNVRLSIILEQAQDVLSVPYDAIYTNAQGQDCVIELQPQESGMFLLAEVPVETGIESALYTQVSGDGLYEGMRIVSTASTYRAMVGREMAVAERGSGISSPGGQGGMMMMMGGRAQ